MINDKAMDSGGKKVITAILIALNLMMLVIGILTIPPNLQSAEVNDSPGLSAEQTGPATTSLDKESTPPSMDSEDIPEYDEASVNLSTEERPDLEDFLWYTEDVVYDGVPSDATILDNLEFLTGSWKALIIYAPNNEYEASAMEFLNISLAGSLESLSLTLDWYQIFWANEGESFDETDMEDSVFNGKWENGGLWASGVGTIRLTQFYEQNGKQYAVGKMDTPDGIPALLAMVRP
ncbi:TPA: hypothetical protein ACGOO8_001993 [Streptococcus suis]